jgi:PPP family 3-phenylpropionic acid transporter
VTFDARWRLRELILAGRFAAYPDLAEAAYAPPRLMRDVRLQYFLLYGILGTVLPYASVFFRQAGLSAAEVGYAFAIWSGASILSPVLITYVADTRVDARRLIAINLAISGLSLLALGFVHSVWLILGVWTIHCLTILAAMPVLDGLCFTVQRLRQSRGQAAPPYHQIRVWGTIGFMLPTLLLFGFLYFGMPVRGALMSGAIFAAVAAVQAVRIRNCPPPPSTTQPNETRDNGHAADDDEPTVPTAAAFRSLFQPGLRVFCAAMFLMQMATAMHGTFFPVYLTERAGVDAKWIGLIANVGVVAEVFFILAMGWLMRTLGFKGLYLAGILGVAARLGLLAMFVSVSLAIGTQLFHGLHIVAIFVLPLTLLDRYADDRCRHSMQGMFGMFTGTGRVVGSLLAGWIGGGGSAALQGIMGLGSSLALAAAVLVILGLRRLPDARAAAAAENTPPERCDPAQQFAASPAAAGEPSAA